MKMKRLLAWLLALAMCFALAACGQNATEDFAASKDKSTASNKNDPAKTGTATPLLYRVTDGRGNMIWLFGSIHIGREDFYPLPDYVLEAFESADSLAVEADIVAFEKDFSRQKQAMAPLVYTDGSTIQDHIPEELYNEAVEILKEYKSYASAMDMYCPALWSSMIESLMMEDLGGNFDLGIDRNLLDMAYDAEKEILEIESAEFQYQMLADFDDDLQIMMLESSIESQKHPIIAKLGLKMMMDLWASGDESAFAAYLNASDDTMTEEEAEIYAEYRQAMISDRNLTMASYAENALASGKKVFICVGAAHIVGAGAMAELLSQRGYRVERVTGVEPTDQFFKTEDIVSITFYAYYGGGEGSEVPEENMTEIINWLHSFTIEREATDDDVLDGTNTYYVEIEYSDGTVIKEGLDVVMVDGVRYCLKKAQYPDCFQEIISEASL